MTLRGPGIDPARITTGADNAMRKSIFPVGTALLASMLLSGCLTVPNIPYQAGVKNSATLLSGKHQPMRVGDFAAAAGVENRKLNVRGANSLSGSASDGTFSTYLKEALQTELATAGVLDPNAMLVVTGTLQQNMLSDRNAAVGARFVVKRNGETVYDRVLTARHSWESSFMGAIAIPTAFQNHVATVQMLLGQLFSDPDFKRATGVE